MLTILVKAVNKFRQSTRSKMWNGITEEERNLISYYMFLRATSGKKLNVTFLLVWITGRSDSISRAAIDMHKNTISRKRIQGSGGDDHRNKSKRRNQGNIYFWEPGGKQEDKRHQILGASKVRQRHGIQKRSRICGPVLLRAPDLEEIGNNQHIVSYFL